jgi:hypothetical protein
MKFDVVLSNLKTLLPATDFIVTGSYVLAKYGLMPWSKVLDLDIILIKPEVSALHVMNNYMKTFPASSTARLRTTVLPISESISEPIIKSKPVDNDDFDDDEKPMPKFAKVAKAEPQKSALQAIFIFDTVKVDIFIENGFNEPTLLIDGLKHTTVSHILTAKKSYGRMKDWMQCREMSRLFFTEEDFQVAINRDWRSMLKSDY